MNLNKIGVVGAGIMGADVAFDLAANGFFVILKDIDAQCLASARQKIQSDFRGYQMMKKELKGVSVEAILERIEFSLTFDGFNEVDLVIENISEDWDKKQNLYSELAEICKPTTYFAVNTSCISITKVGSLLKEPNNVIGVHFMNPVPLKKMVEVIRGEHTSEETVAFIGDFLKSLGKRMVVVNDFPGFAANRLSHLFMNEAAYLVQDQVANAKDIDRLFREGYGHQMGPLETADLIGLDTVVNSLNILYESYQDSKFRCCPLLRRMVDAGYLGKKSGKGFYEYN